MPVDLVIKIQSEVAKFVRQPEVKKQFATLGFEPIGSMPEYFAKYIKDEMEKYQQIIKDAKIKVE